MASSWVEPEGSLAWFQSLSSWIMSSYEPQVASESVRISRPQAWSLLSTTVYSSVHPGTPAAGPATGEHMDVPHCGTTHRSLSGSPPVAFASPMGQNTWTQRSPPLSHWAKQFPVCIILTQPGCQFREVRLRLQGRHRLRTIYGDNGDGHISGCGDVNICQPVNHYCKPASCEEFLNLW